MSVGALIVTGIVFSPIVVNAAAAPKAKSPTKQAAPAKKKKALAATTTKASGGRKPPPAPPPLTAESLGLTTPLSEAVGATPSSTGLASKDPPPPSPSSPTTAPSDVAAPSTTPAPPTAATETNTPIASPIDLSGSHDRVVEPQPPPRRRLTIGLNPLPVIAGRYGLNVEIVPFAHHAIIASAYYQTFTPTMLRVVMPGGVDVSHGADARVGGELGYRLYSGSHGAHGLFAGISGVAVPIAYPRVTPDFRSEVVSFNTYGGAFDVGVQAITSSGFTIGGGIGVMYLAYTPPASPTPPPGTQLPTIIEPHVLPRLLFAAGWSF